MTYQINNLTGEIRRLEGDTWVPATAQEYEASQMSTGEALLTGAGRTFQNVINRATGAEADPMADYAMGVLDAERPVAAGVGRALPALATMPLGGGLVTQAALGAGTGAAFAEPGRAGTDAALGAGGAAVGQMAGRVAGRLSNMMRSTRGATGPMGQAFEATGGELTPAMRTGRRGSKILEAGFESNALTADDFAAIGARNIENVNDLAARAIGIPDAELVGRLDTGTLARADDLLGSQFDALLSRANPVRLGKGQTDALRAAGADSGALGDRLARVHGINLADDTLELSPQVFKEIRSELAADVMTADGAGQRNLVDALQGMSDAFRRTNGDLWDEYRVLSGRSKTIRALGKGNAVSSDGNINPRTAFGNMKRAWKDTVRTGETYGDAAVTQDVTDLIDNLRAGSSQELTAPFGNSGTAERSFNILSPQRHAQGLLYDTYMRGNWSPYGFLDKAPAGSGRTGAAIGRAAAPGLLGD